MLIHKKQVFIPKSTYKKLRAICNGKSDELITLEECVKFDDEREMEFSFKPQAFSGMTLDMKLILDKKLEAKNKHCISKINDLMLIYDLKYNDNLYLIEFMEEDTTKDYSYYKKIRPVLMNNNLSYLFWNMMYYINFSDEAEFIKLLFYFLYTAPHVKTGLELDVKAISFFKDKLDYYGYDKTYMDNISVNYYIDDFFRDENYKKDVFMFRVFYDTHGLFEYFLARTYLSIKTNDNERVGKNVLKNAYSMYYEILEEDKYFDKLKKRD